MTLQGLEVEPKFRRETRAPLVAHVQIDYPDEESPESAFTANVSMGGFFVQSSKPRPIGTSFRSGVTLGVLLMPSIKGMLGP